MSWNAILVISHAGKMENGENVWTEFMDVLRAFDTIIHDMLLAKL